MALLTDGVFMSMPPIPYQYVGRQPVAGFFAPLFAAGRAVDLVPVRASGQPAFGAYVAGPDGTRTATGLITITPAGDQVCAASRFEASVLRWFGLPATLPPALPPRYPTRRYV